MLFKARIEAQFSFKIKTLRSDGGGEYTSSAFKSYLQQYGITYQLSCPYTPQQNDLVERKHRHLIETTITMLSQASMSTTYQSYAALIAVSLINLLPTFVLSFVLPWFKLYSSHSDLSQLKVFGYACYPYLRSYSNHKLEPRTKECFFLGYSSTSKGYLCLDVQTQHLHTSRHVLFNETKFPFPTLSKLLPSFSSPTSVLSNSICLSNLLYLHSPINYHSWVLTHLQRLHQFLPIPLSLNLHLHYQILHHCLLPPYLLIHLSLILYLRPWPLNLCQRLPFSSQFHLQFLPLLLLFCTPCRLGPRVTLLSLTPVYAIRQSQITPTHNLPHIKQPLNILNGVKPWMLNVKSYRSSILGLWFQLLLMPIWLDVSGFSSLS